VNAVQVTTRRTAATGNAVATYFAPLLGVTQEDVTAVAIAVGGGPSSTCGSVFALPSCLLFDALGNLNCNATLTLNSNNADVFMTLLSLTLPSLQTIECALVCSLGILQLLPLPLLNCTCSPNNCTPTAVNSQIKLTIGTNLSLNIITYLQLALANSLNGLYVQLPVFNLAVCPAALISNVQPVTGYVRVRITGASGLLTPSVTMSVDCSSKSSTLPAQGFFGYRTTAVYLAK